MQKGIDEIFQMLSCDNDWCTQQAGLAAAMGIRHISIFFQPRESKKIWENCARVITAKSDRELEIYIFDMCKWIQDMNWPGADLIFDRLKLMPPELTLKPCEWCIKQAIKMNDYAWECAIRSLLIDSGSLTE